MPDEGQLDAQGFLTLLRAELSVAITSLELRMVDRYATKTDASALTAAFADHERQDEFRFEKILEELKKLGHLNEDRMRQIADEQITSTVGKTWAIRGGKVAISALLVAVASVVITVVLKLAYGG